MGCRDLDRKHCHAAARRLAQLDPGDGDGAVDADPVFVQRPAHRRQRAHCTAKTGAGGVAQLHEQVLVQLVQRIAVHIDQQALDRVAGGKGQRAGQVGAVIAAHVLVDRGQPAERRVIHRDHVAGGLGQADGIVDPLSLGGRSALDRDDRRRRVVVLHECGRRRAVHAMIAGHGQTKAFAGLGGTVVDQVHLDHRLGLAGLKGHGAGSGDEIGPGPGAAVARGERKAACLVERLGQIQRERRLAPGRLRHHQIAHLQGPVDAQPVIVQRPALGPEAVEVAAKADPVGIAQFQHHAFVTLVQPVRVHVGPDCPGGLARRKGQRAGQIVAVVGSPIDVAFRRSRDELIINLDRIGRGLGQTDGIGDPLPLDCPPCLD